MSPDDWSPSAATWAWALIGIAALATQAIALAMDGTDGKLSRHVEAARRHRVLRVALFAAWGWLTAHWVVLPEWWPRARWRFPHAADLAAAAVPAVFAAGTDPTRNEEQ